MTRPLRLSILARFFREYRRRWSVRAEYDDACHYRNWPEVDRLEREEPWLR